MNASRALTALLLSMLSVSLPPARAQQPLSPMGFGDSATRLADTNVKIPQYEIISVKEVPLNAQNVLSGSMAQTPYGFRCVHIPFKLLIASAYGFKPNRIFGGPGWMDSTTFDIDATLAPQDREAYERLSKAQRALPLQALLVEVFDLKVHTETKILPTYDLVIAKGGPKLQPSDSAAVPAALGGAGTAANPYGSLDMVPGSATGQDINATGIAYMLSSISQRKVVDKTGLTGRYDVQLNWAMPGERVPPGAKSGDSLPTAVEKQLGLKLQSAKGPTEVLVIESAQKPRK